MLIVRALLLALVIVGIANADYKKRIQHHYEMYALLQEQEEIFAFAVDVGIYEAICYLEILEVSPWIREEDAIDALDHNTILIDGEERISMSGRMTADKKEYISVTLNYCPKDSSNLNGYGSHGVDITFEEYKRLENVYKGILREEKINDILS